MKIARPTSVLLVVVLLAVGLVVGRLAPPVLTRLDLSTPRISWAAPLTLALAAVAVGIFAWNTWQSLHKRHERMTSQHAITMLSLAKSCAVVGALVAGLYGGFALAFVDALDSMLGRERFVRGLAAAVASLLLLLAALLLERACRLPEDDEDEKAKKPKGRPDATPA